MEETAPLRRPRPCTYSDRQWKWISSQVAFHGPPGGLAQSHSLSRCTKGGGLAACIPTEVFQTHLMLISERAGYDSMHILGWSYSISRNTCKAKEHLPAVCCVAPCSKLTYSPCPLWLSTETHRAVLRSARCPIYTPTISGSRKTGRPASEPRLSPLSILSRDRDRNRVSL